MATDEFEVHFKVTYDEITRRRTMRLPSEHTFEALHNEVALMFGLTGPAVLCCKGQLLLTDDDVKAAISEKNIRLQILGVMSLNMLPSCKLKEAEPEAPEPEPEAPTAPEPEAPADEPEAPAPEAPEPTPEALEPEASAPAPSAPASASLAEASVIVAPPLRPTAPAFTPTTPRAATSIPPAAPGNPWADMARAAPPAYPGDRWRDYPSLTDAFPPVTTAPGHRCQTCAAVFRNRKGLHRHIRHTHGQTLPLVSRPPTVKDSDVGQLITMGFNARYAREALRQSNGDFDAALELLLSGTLEA